MMVQKPPHHPSTNHWLGARPAPGHPTTWDPMMDTHITQRQLHPILSPFKGLAAHDFHSSFEKCARLARSSPTSKPPRRTHPTLFSSHRIR